MDTLVSAQWVENLRSETRSKEKWESKYLSADEKSAKDLELATHVERLRLKALEPVERVSSERDAGLRRLAALDDVPDVPEERPVSSYLRMRQLVAEKVAAHRHRSHRITDNLTSEGMLEDMGQALWGKVNPGYTTSAQASSSHLAHAFGQRCREERPDKTHHLKLNEFMRHADKCLALGEKPFTAGGMKAPKLT